MGGGGGGLGGGGGVGVGGGDVPPPHDDVQCVQSMYFQWNTLIRFSVLFLSGSVYSNDTPGFCDWNSSCKRNTH